MDRDLKMASQQNRKARFRAAAHPALDLQNGNDPPALLEPRVHPLALQREDPEDALVDAAQRLAADEPLQPLDAERELPQSQRPTKSSGLTTMPSPPRPVRSCHQLMALSTAPTSSSATVRYGVASNSLGSAAQTLASVCMCQSWFLSVWTTPSVASKWNGASLRSSIERTGQQ